MDIDLSKFEQANEETVTEWVLTVQALLGSGVEFWHPTLKAAIDEMADQVNDNWAELQEDNQAEFRSVPAMETANRAGLIGDEALTSVCALTAITLISGLDGPHVTATVLKEGIDSLVEAM